VEEVWQVEGMFDVIVAVGVFEFIADPDRILQQAYGRLRKQGGGVFGLIFPENNCHIK